MYYGWLYFQHVVLNSLEGDNITETTNILTFKGDTVTEKQDGKGTYTISDNQLEIKSNE